MRIKTIGIIGAGKMGVVLAQLALKAGYTVYVSGSGAPSKIRLAVDTLGPGAIVGTNAVVAQKADIILLALPLGKVRELATDDFTGKLVIDATNHWWEVDGPRSDILAPEQSSSEAVQEHLAGSRIVKAFSHMGYHDAHDGAKPAGAPDRKAIAIAGNNERDVAVVSKMVDDFGFDPLPIGSLEQGTRLEPGGAAFGANLTLSALRHLLENDRTEPHSEPL